MYHGFPPFSSSFDLFYNEQSNPLFGLSAGRYMCIEESVNIFDSKGFGWKARRGKWC